MKRLAEVPITAFFARKQPRRPSFDSQETESVDSEEGEAADQQKQPPPPLQTARGGRAHREAREDVLGILQRRELVGCATTRQLHGAAVAGPRRRRRQELVRWALTRLERLPVELQLAPHWERQAGALRNEAFYASCMEFDAQGVLLAVGASNGIIALFDFDDVFHRSLNVEQTAHARLNEGAEKAEETKPAIEILHPLHTIFTPFEVKRIRWNPLNQVAHTFLVISIDEIACSFSNRNEIHLFNLRKFPSKPHRVLKSSSHPSSGYNDLLFLPAPVATGALRTRRPVGANAKPRPRTCTIIAGDMDGAIRMWDPRFPMRPMWSFPVGKQPINALVLSPSKQFLVCGTEAGVLMTYDIQHTVVPAFGSKPVPQRKASINVMEAIKPYLSPACIEAVLLSVRSGSPGIMSLRMAPHSETQVLCQLRNDWIVVIDYLLGSVVKLHTLIRGSTLGTRPKANLPASVLTVPAEIELDQDVLPRSSRNSWLSCHRCTGSLLFGDSIMCTGVHDATNLNVIDLHQLRRIDGVPIASNNGDTAAETRRSDAQSRLDAVERLDRFRISMDGVVTAVAAHPNQHAVICGGENLRLQVMGIVGGL